MPGNMCPKSSKSKTKGEVQENKKNSGDKPTPIKKKTKGEIKHDKKVMKRRAKLGEDSCEDTQDNWQVGGFSGNANSNDLELSEALESAFVQSIIEKSGLRFGSGHGDDGKPRKLSFTEEELQDDFLDGFSCVKKGKVAKPTMNKTSEGFGFEAYKYIIENKKEKGNQLLNRALALDQFDVRHYYNRSYTNLCTGRYQEALEDIQFVLHHTDDPIYLARMKCRQGQVLKEMQQFDKAEECFEECLNFFPNSITVRCEFMHMKIARLQTMGFPERDIISLLYDNPYLTLRDAVNFLVDLPRLQPAQGPQCAISLDENEEFQSDTEDDPSNARLFMEMTNFNSYTKDDVWYRELPDNSKAPTPETKAPGTRPPNLRPAKSLQQHQPSSPGVKELRVINASGVKKTPKINVAGGNVNNKAVWVGSLKTDMTETALKRAFASAFGPVVSVYRAESCAFVNFESLESAHLALEAESLEVLGKTVLIKSNKRSR